MAEGSSRLPRRSQKPRGTLAPLPESKPSSSTTSHVEAITHAMFAPFQRRRGESSLLTDLAPMLMTPKLMSAAASSSSKHRSSLGGARLPSNRLDLIALGRTPLRFGLNTRRITSTDLQIAEATDELLAKDIPEHANNISLLRGFKATIPSSERNKTRRRQMRNVDAPRMGLKKLGMHARGLLMDEDEDSSRSVSEDDMVVVNRADGKGKRRARESLGASVALGKEELGRQTEEILLDKENIHIRRALLNNQIAEITFKLNSLTSARTELEQDLLKLQEDELELDDELEGVHERMQFEENAKGVRLGQDVAHSSRRRKGPAFLPSEHDELPPGVAFLTFSSHHTPISALDFSEPYGTLVSASSAFDTSGKAEEDLSPIVWDLLTASEIGRLHGHRGAVKTLQVEDHVCLTGADDGAVRVWDLRRVGDDDDLVSVPGVGCVEDSAEDSKLNGIRNGDSTDDDFDLADGPCARVLEGHSKAVTALFFEENCLVTGASDKTLRQWDLTTGQCVLTMDILWAMSHPHPNALSTPDTTLDFSATWDMGGRGGSSAFVGGVQFWGYGLVSGSADGAVRMWDMRTGQAHRTLIGHAGPVTSLQFDELHIVSGSMDKTVRIWDLRTMSPSETIQFEGVVTSIQFDSRKVVAAAGENAVRIFNRTTRQFSGLSTNGHAAPVQCLRYMDKYLVSGGGDSTVKVWAL